MKIKKISRKRFFETIQIGKETDSLSRVVKFILVGLIMIDLGLSICSSFNGLVIYQSIFSRIEAIIQIGFIIELCYYYVYGQPISCMKGDD